MSDKNMKRRAKISTADLKVGTIFYLSEQSDYTYRITARGPKGYAYVTGDDVNQATCHEHEDVWIDSPRTKVGEFKVGEKFRRRYTYAEPNNPVFLVTAIGKKNSLAMPSKEEDGYEYKFLHEDECEEVSDDE